VLVDLWRSWRPPASDVALTAGFVVLGQLVTWGQLENPEGFQGPRALNAVLNLLLMVSIAWRRRAPLASVSFAFAVYFLPHAVVPLDVPFLAGAVPLIVLTASAGYYCVPRRAVLAAALAMVAVVIVTLTTPGLRDVESLVVNSVFVLVPWAMARGLRTREDRAAALATALATERAGTEAALRDAAATERAHIARELHDIVAHSVSMMVIQVGAARMRLQNDPATATGPLLEAEEAGRQTLQDLRRLLGVLRTDEPSAADDPADVPPQPPQPGLGQLDALVGPLRATGLEVEVAVHGDPTPLSPALDLTAFRVVQEALTNTLKHSGAKRASVGLTWTPAALLIDVVDDGTARRTLGDRGHGLTGLRERAALFGGSVTAGRPEGGGWQVAVRLPMPTSALPEQGATAVPTP
jgi:signal transduction histidine kinase